MHEPKTIINRSLFVKSKPEKDAVKAARLNYKNRRKNNNIKLKDMQKEFVSVILGSKTPNWGSANVIMLK